MKRRTAMAYNPHNRPRHPIAVAEMNDSAALMSLVACLERNLDELSTQPARRAAMDSIVVLNTTIKQLTP